MKKTTLIKHAALVILLLSVITLTMSSRGKNSLPSQPPASTTTPDKTLTVTLQNIPSLPKPSNRNYPCPASPYLGSGNGTPATTIDDVNKFYCVITVTNLNSSSWGTNGIKTKIWDVTNPTATSINVSVPGGHNYKVKVDYYEVKNGFWTDFIWGRGKWSTEQNFNAGYAGNWGFYQWIFMQRLT